MWKNGRVIAAEDRGLNAEQKDRGVMRAAYRTKTANKGADESDKLSNCHVPFLSAQRACFSQA